jgi:hypothetical protein
MIETIPFILLYLLFGLLWADFMLWFRNKYVPNIPYGKTTRYTNTFLWPGMLCIFVIGFIIGLINYFRK